MGALSQLGDGAVLSDRPIDRGDDQTKPIVKKFGKYDLVYEKGVLVPSLLHSTRLCLIEAVTGDEVVGELLWHPTEHGAAYIEVEPEHRRAGLATAMIRLAK